MVCIQDEIPFDVPDGWCWCRLCEICNVSSAKRVLQKDWKDRGIPFYRAREIAALSKNKELKKDVFISESLYEDLKKNYGVPQEEDLLISAVGTIGQVYIVKASDKFYYKDASVICLKKKNKMILSKFIKNIFASNYLKEIIYAESKGTTVDTITISKAEKYIFPLPPLEEQRLIVAKIEELFAQVDSIESNKTDLQTFIKHAKSKVLDLAIHGKLVPQDANDESASDLLEKIRQEKEAKIAAGEIKRDKNESFIYRKASDNLSL